MTRRTLRVLRIIPTIDAEAGGPTTTVVNSAIAEARAGIVSTLCFTADADGSGSNGEAAARLLAAGVIPRGFRRQRWPSRAGAWGLSPRMTLWLVRNVRRYDLVHLHYVWCFTTIAGAILGRLARRPVVLTPHESLTSFDVDVTSGNPVKRFLKRALRRLILSNVDVVVYASDLEREDSQEVPHRSRRIYHPVIESVAVAPAPEPGGPVKLGFLGRIHPKKNLRLVIDAIARLNEEGEGEGFDLTIAGRGDAATERELLSHAEGLGVAPRIEWLGFVPSSGREEFLAGIHMLVMPSRYESFGMSAAESMAAGVPPIVSRRTGIASLVDEFDAGAVLPEPSLENLIAAVRRVDHDPGERARYREHSLRAATERLTFAAYATEIGVLYSDLLEGDDPRTRGRNRR